MIPLVDSNILMNPERLVLPFSWSGHIPFAFWLVSELKPRVLVELGTHTGNSYFSFCQAVAASGVETKCWAVDTWCGDSQAGYYGDEVFEDVQDYNAGRYSDFSTLLRCSFDETVHRFADGSIDLLHIDGLHTYDSVKNDFELWLPKLSSQAVVLFHDICVTKSDFEVWRFWGQLKKTYLSFEFAHSSGLGLLIVGANVPTAINRLFSMPEDERQNVRSLFQRLGAAVSAEASIGTMSSDMEEQKSGIGWLRAQVDTRDKDIKWLKRQLASREQEACETIDEDRTSQVSDATRHAGPAIKASDALQAKFLAKTFFFRVVYACKARVKGSVGAPMLFRAYAILRSWLHTLACLPDSRQNGPAIQALVENRQAQLLSQNNAERYNLDMSDMALPAIDVSIVTFNSAEWLDSFLISLCELAYPCWKLSLHFIDHGSKDRTVAILKKFSADNAKRFRCIDIQEAGNVGFGRGHHRVIMRCRSKLVLVCNVDVQLDKNSLRIAANKASADPESVACWEFRQFPYEHPKYVDPVTLETSWCSHACILIRREAYVAVGGYESRIFMYGEDVELSYRFRAKGYTLKYVPRAIVWHKINPSKSKPLQFSGSTLANGFIRLRYGNALDILTILPLQLSLLVRGGGYRGSRLAIASNMMKIICSSAYFLSSRQQSRGVYFPFRGFDYELTRYGANYKAKADCGESPSVSIITRTHGEDTGALRECIASVLNQSHVNIEHIVVEDGGCHKQELASQVNQAYQGAYTLRYFSLANVGRSAAGNKGLERASSEYCLFLDEDDLLLPDHIATLLSELQADLDVVATYSLAWDSRTRWKKSPSSASKTYTGPESDPDAVQVKTNYVYEEVAHITEGRFYQPFDREILKRHNYLPIQSVLFRRDLYRRAGGFDEAMTYLEDWDLWKRYAHCGDFKWVKKTTSLYHTPDDVRQRVSRQVRLDSAYQHAVDKDQGLHLAKQVEF